MYRLTLVLGFFCAAIAPAKAAFWKGELPGGTYVVSLPTISSVSVHEYVVEAGVRVTEVTVDTSGSVVARFYYIEPIVPKSPVGVGQSVIEKVEEKLGDAVERTGQDAIWKRVTKSYPVATHAHTVEYRLDDKEQLAKIFKSLERAWRNNAETTLKVP